MKYIIVAVVVSMLCGCSIKPQKRIEANVEKAWYLDGAGVRFVENSSGIDHGTIYIARYEDMSTVAVYFFTFSGEIIETIRFKIGKGPGYIGHPAAVKIYNGKIYIYDDSLRKISIFSRKGVFIDDILISDIFGIGGTIDIEGKFLYYHGFYQNKLVKYDMEQATVVRSIAYSDFKKEDLDKDEIKIRGGYLKVDQERDALYIGYYNGPYCIEIFNRGLEKKCSLKRKNAEQKFPLVQTRRGFWSGTFSISSLCRYEDFLIASSGGGTLIKNGKPSALKESFSISVFDLESRKLRNEITIRQISHVVGNAYIIGITEDYIVLYMSDEADTFERVSQLYDYEENAIKTQFNIKTKEALIILKNSIKKQSIVTD